MPVAPARVSEPLPPTIEFARELPVILTAVVREEALTVLIAELIVTGDLVLLVTVIRVEDVEPPTIVV